MRRRLVILTEIISPYRIPLFNALAQLAEVDLHVIFLAETDPTLRQWQVYREEIRFSHQILPSWRKRVGRFNVLLNRGVSRALATAAPEVILCGGYSYLASWQCLIWARAQKVPFFVVGEQPAGSATRPCLCGVSEIQVSEQVQRICRTGTVGAGISSSTEGRRIDNFHRAERCGQ